MSDYQVFARKYRPRTFADVLGQDHVIQTLRNAIAQDRLAHAYLFVGPRGTGKTSTARILAKALNCPGGPKIDFDPDDPICREIAEGSSLDVLEIDGASNNGVDQVRELRDTVGFAPANGQFKIYYIDEVHMLTTQAFNALLKTLEEPPAHVKFIFATTEPNKILPTILSRCQRFDLRRIPARVIADHLAHIATEEGIELDEAAAFAIAKGADGGMRDAQSMLDQLVAFCGEKITEAEVLDIFGFNSQEAVADFAGVVLGQDTGAALGTVHQQSESGKDLGKLLADLISHYRHLLVTKVSPNSEQGDVAPEIATILEAQAAQVSTERLLALIDHLAGIDGRMKWASNKRLHLEIGVIKAVQILGETNLSDVVALLSDAAGAAAAAPAAVATGSDTAPARAAAPTSSPTPAATPSTAAQKTPPTAEPAQAQAQADSGAPAANSLEGDALWQATVAHCHEQRPLVDMWIREATFLGDVDNEVRVGFPPSKGVSRDSLERHRKFLEAALATLSGRKLKLSLVLDETLESATPVDAAPQADSGEPEAAEAEEHPPFDADSDASAAGASPAPVAEAPPTEPAADEGAASDPFHDDPLIRSALEEFEATIVKTESS